MRLTLTSVCASMLLVLAACSEAPPPAPPAAPEAPAPVAVEAAPERPVQLAPDTASLPASLLYRCGDTTLTAENQGVDGLVLSLGDEVLQMRLVPSGSGTLYRDAAGNEFAAKGRSEAILTRAGVDTPCVGVSSDVAAPAADQYPVAQSSCLSAVAAETGIARDILKVDAVVWGDPGSPVDVRVQVPGAEALWSCFSDEAGIVQRVMYTGDEGAL